MFGLSSNIGEWLQAMGELHRRQVEATERLAAAAERMADALEGHTENGKAEALVGEGAAFEVLAEAAGRRRRR